MSKTDDSKRNRAEHWNARQQAVKTEKELVGVMVDYCRSVAAKASGGDPSHPVWRDLAQHLHGWATDHAP